jgi:hypothetical protein
MNGLTIFLGILILIGLAIMRPREQEGFSSEPSIQIVVARYNESLNWLKEEPFNKYPVLCYNSGPNTNFYKPPSMRVVEIEDVGKEPYVYLYHIIHNYNGLADITIFLPGSTDSIHKIGKARQQIYEIEKHKKTVFIASKYENVRDNLYDFKLDSYCSTSPENSKENSECAMNPASVRPFGAWYDQFFKGVTVQHVNYMGILGVQREHIVQTPKQKYELLLEELQDPNDEVAHYFERSWAAIFHPLEGAVFL